MFKAQSKTELFFVFIIFSSVFFVGGLAISYAIPIDSALYTLFENSLSEVFSSCKSFSIGMLSSSFCGELKYLLFILVGGFSSYRKLLFTAVCSLKGLLTGIYSACLMRSIKLDRISVQNELFGCLIFVLLSVFVICALCFCCCKTYAFAKKQMYPIKIRSFLKRRDTYCFAVDFFAICGAVLIATALKYITVYLMIS